MPYRTGMVLVLAAGVLWSFQALVIRQIEVAGPWALLFWRSLAMLATVAAFLGWRRGRAALAVLRASGAAGILGGLALVAAMSGAIVAFQSTTVANAAFLFAAAPFLAAILGRLVLREPLSGQTVACIGLALAGIFVMVQDGLSAGNWLGNAAALISATGFAAFTVALRWRRVADTLPISALGGAFAVLAGGGVALATGQPLAIPAADLAWCVLMGVVTMSGGMILYTLGSRVVPSGELALLSNTEILLAPIWVWLLMGETASPATLAGGAILLVAILLNGASGLRRSRTLPAVAG